MDFGQPNAEIVQKWPMADSFLALLYSLSISREKIFTDFTDL